VFTNFAGVEDVELMMDKENAEVNRGFGFITFYNYACAEAARRKYTEMERT
jgi:RNA recognition motif-containing protein